MTPGSSSPVPWSDDRHGAPGTGQPDTHRFESVPAVRESLAKVDYLADDGIAGIVYLADRLGKPVLVEGPAGTGKTQLAKSVAEITGARLIRLQCYEGLDESKALYEWNYKKQLLRIQAERNDGATWSDVEDDIFSDEFLLTRPLLEAIRAEDPVVLLIDEVDRVEVETEALLLEILSDYQVSIPELGTVTARQIPLVFLTSNNTRELSEALKRRCLFLHVDYPDLERETEIVLAKVPGITESLADQVARIVRSIRQLELKKAPVGVRDARLGPHAAAARRRAGRRRDRHRHGQHPAQVPERHRQGDEGARAGHVARRRGRRVRGQALAAQWLTAGPPPETPTAGPSAYRRTTGTAAPADAGITAGRHREHAGAGAAAGTEGRRESAGRRAPGRPPQPGRRHPAA